jgi:hypothetical protein
MSTAQSAAIPRKTNKWLKRALGCLLAVSATGLLLEIALHALVLGDTQHGTRLRHARLYADRRSEAFYYQLDQHLRREPGELPLELENAQLGWVDPAFDRVSFAHTREADLAGRRPVLLFGDSYARCMCDELNCFEGLMEHSEWAASHRLYNYGVRGYGIDQVAILMRAVLPQWQDRNPLVVIGIYMEDDLDRAMLSYRGWPKPRFELDSSGVLIEPKPVPSAQEYTQANPMWRHSLAWGWLLQSSGLLPEALSRRLSGAGQHERRTCELSGAILKRMEYDLALAGVQHFFVLFPGPGGTDTLEPRDWRERFLLNWMEAYEQPYISMRRELLRGAIEEMRLPEEYFGRGGVFAGHLTPDGNRIAFRGIERGLRGEFDRNGWPVAPHPSELSKLAGQVRKQSGVTSNFPDWADSERILMVPMIDEDARVGCLLSQPARRFLTSARVLHPEGLAQSSSVQLEILVDGTLVYTRTIDSLEAGQNIEIKLFAHTRIELVASVVAGTLGGRLVLSHPRFQ